MNIEWVDPKERMPENQKCVAVIVENACGRRLTIAEHISSHSVKSEDFLSVDCDPGDLDTYDEVDDCYYVNENWFESNLYSEDNWQVADPVLFWAEIPLPQVGNIDVSK